MLRRLLKTCLAPLGYKVRAEQGEIRIARRGGRAAPSPPLADDPKSFAPYAARFSVDDLEADFLALYAKSAPYTLVSLEGAYAVYKAVEYVVANGIAGALAECGVWRGGISLLMANSLAHFGDTSRELFLYDTFEGMTRPGEHDVQVKSGRPAGALLAEKPRLAGARNVWAYASLEDVKKTMAAAAYPQDRIRYVVGPVESTIPAQAPAGLSLLRLDTDWYESTRHELIHLYPLLAAGGVVLFDDYGHWEGARKAIDEYFEQAGKRPLLTRVDPGGRLMVKG